MGVELGMPEFSAGPGIALLWRLVLGPETSRDLLRAELLKYFTVSFARLFLGWRIEFPANSTPGFGPRVL